ncbi:MAG TPA: hypothetical protein VGN57_00245 [Pirellulaceae bacterium]|jgi:hypothetical protein|nr:hypothetical protein [Pirellulaceae bacterium]
MFPLSIDSLATTAVQGLAAAFAPLAQLTGSNEGFEATLRGTEGSGANANSGDASPETLATRLQDLGESIRSTLERKLGEAGVALDRPLELERNAFGQWSLVDANAADRVAVEQALSELPPDFLEKLTEFRRALAEQEEAQGGFGGALANLIDPRDAVRLTVSRDGLAID